MKCNRTWTKIQNQCRRSGTDYNFRYDVINRSFEMRSDQLSDIIYGQEIAVESGVKCLGLRFNRQLAVSMQRCGCGNTKGEV